MKITLLVGTMTGTAQLCAQEMELVLDDGETRAETLLMDGLDAAVFTREGLFLICTSFTGTSTGTISSPVVIMAIEGKEATFTSA